VAILKGKDKEEVNTKRKYKQEKKDASYEKQKEASDKGNRNTNNLYSAKIYTILRCIRPRCPYGVQQ